MSDMMPEESQDTSDIEWDMDTEDLSDAQEGEGS